MKMTYIRITILAYFLNDTLNQQVLWGKEKYLLNNLYEKLRNKVLVLLKCKQKRICLFQGRIIGQIYSSTFLSI